MLKKTYFRTLCRILQRTLIVSVVGFASMFSNAWGIISDGAEITLLNPCESPASTLLYVSPFGTRITGVYRRYDRGAMPPFLNLMSPLPNATNPVTVARGTCFAGYTYDQSITPYDYCMPNVMFSYLGINSYGELSQDGYLKAVSYARRSSYNWYAMYLDPRYTIKLDSSDADIGHHGQEFLYYGTYPGGYLGLFEYVYANDIYQPVVPKMAENYGYAIEIPSRTGYTFTGYYSAPTGGTQYIDASGTVTSAGLATLPNMTWPNSGINACNVWYAQWEQNPPTGSTHVLNRCYNAYYTNNPTEFFYSNSNDVPFLNYSSGTYSNQITSSPNFANPVTVPNNTCFIGYCGYETDCFNGITGCSFNSYGEWTGVGPHGAAAQYLSAKNYLKLDSSDADPGQHGTEFLGNENGGINGTLILTVNTNNLATTGIAWGVILADGNVITNNTITVPVRIGSTFAGYYSAQNGGTQYIDATGHLTQAGLNALSAAGFWMGGPGECPVWYAHWETYSNVTYNPGTCTNGVTGSSQTFNNDATYGSAYTLRGLGTGNTKSGITVNSGFHFNGWLGSSNDANYTPATYTETQTINPYNIVGDFTLTAQVAGNTTTINYSCGTGIGISGNPPSPDTMTRACTQMTPNDGHLFWWPAQNNGQNPCARTGHRFVGWDCPDITCSGSAGMCTHGLGVLWSNYNWADGTSVTCTAVYAPYSYTVTYDYGTHAANGATGTAYTHTNGASYGVNYTVPAAANAAITPATGYTFVGWNTANNQTTSNWNGATPWTQTSGLTVYAAYDCAAGFHWVNGACVGYSLMYMPGANGQGSNYTEQVSGGVTHNLQSPGDIGITPASAGYAFSHWTCVDSGSNSVTVTNNSITMPSLNVTCTAQWDCAPGYAYDSVSNTCKVAYTISYVCHGCSNQSMADQYPVFAGNSVTLSQNTFTAPYHYFNGWSCRTSGNNGVPVSVTQSGNNYIINPMPAANVTCAAVWHGNPYDVIYNRGAHGSGSDYTDGATYGVPYTVLTRIAAGISPESAAYVFAGWLGDYAHSVSGVQTFNYTEQESFHYMIPDDLTLTAQWNCASGYHWNAGNTACVQDSFSVTYSCGSHGSGTPTDSNSPYVSGATVTTLAASVCTADTGYIFTHWSCDNSIGNKNAGTTFTMPSANVSCTAQWDSNVIALTWNTNGGTPSTVTTPSSCIIGSLESEPGSISGIAQPTKTGYRFLGWGIQ